MGKKQKGMPRHQQGEEGGGDAEGARDGWGRGSAQRTTHHAEQDVAFMLRLRGSGVRGEDGGDGGLREVRGIGGHRKVRVGVVPADKSRTHGESEGIRHERKCQRAQLRRGGGGGGRSWFPSGPSLSSPLAPDGCPVFYSSAMRGDTCSCGPGT